MTFIQHLHPDNPATLADEARVDEWDATCPQWRDDRDRFIDYADVADPETNVIWGYGGDHRAIIFGAYA